MLDQVLAAGHHVALHHEAIRHLTHGGLLGIVAFTSMHAREHAEVAHEEADVARSAHPRVVRAFRQAVAFLGSVLLPGRRPRVTVVTPTWQRHDQLVKRCVPSVQAQGYDGGTRHVIVSDGPDGELAGLLPGALFLPEHGQSRNRGVAARRHALDSSDDPVVAYLDDDNAWRPQHLERVAGALLESGADFAYSMAAFHCEDIVWAVGRTPPAFAQVDTSMLVHRRELLSLGNWQESNGPADWDLVHRWLRAGARWAFVPQVTLDYYCHH